MLPMPAQSQRPLVNKLLTLEPLTVGEQQFTSIDHALRESDRPTITIDALAEALGEAGIEVSVFTLRRWRKEVVG